MMDFNVIGTAPWGSVVYNRHDTAIGRCFAEAGEFSQAEVEGLKSVVPAGSTVVDVGANIGAIAIPLAQHVGREGAVVAIEPQRLMFQLLCANAAINSIPNLYPIRVAVGDRRGEVRVAMLDATKPNAPGALEMNAAAAAQAAEVVALMPLDDLLGPAFDRLSLIKIDVEGMEMDVIRGAQATIAKFRPFLYVENDRPANSAALIGQITALGYVCYWHAPRLVREELKDRSALHDVASVNMMCFPVEHPHGIDLEPVLGPDDDVNSGLKRWWAKRQAA